MDSAAPDSVHFSLVLANTVNCASLTPFVMNLACSSVIPLVCLFGEAIGTLSCTNFSNFLLNSVEFVCDPICACAIHLEHKDFSLSLVSFLGVLDLESQFRKPYGSLCL